MGDQDDDARNIALGVVAGVVLLVIAGVIAIAATLGTPHKATANLATAATVAEDPFKAPQALYFEVGSDQLPKDAETVLARIAEAARSRDGINVLISGFHDASGDAAQNAELAKRRALAVRHALEADGVSPRYLVMSRPELTSGGADSRAARRVEMRLQ